MNREASNAFLKILEEPPENTIFLLTAQHEEHIPDTILSRTRIFFVNIHPQAVLSEYLQKHSPHLSQSESERILNAAQGRTGLLLKFLQDSALLLDEESAYEEVERILTTYSTSERLMTAEKIAAYDTNDLFRFFERITYILRNKLLSFTKKNPIKEEISLLMFLIKQAEKTKSHIIQNGNKKLCIERFMYYIGLSDKKLQINLT